MLAGPMAKEAFPAHVGQFLAPTFTRGNVVVLDNLPAHKVVGVREAIRARGTSLLYLPPYSANLNPIRQILCQAEGAASKGRSPHPGGAPDNHQRNSQRLNPDECQNYFTNSGYAFK